MKKHLMIFAAAAFCLLCACQSVVQETADMDISSWKTEGSIDQTDPDIQTDGSSPETGSSIPQAEVYPSMLPDLTVQLEEGSKYSYFLVRREQTVLSRQDGSVCSSMFYEMPVVLVFDEEMQGYIFDKGSQWWYRDSKDEHAEIAAINAALEQECRNFFENSSEFTLLSQDLATRHTGEYGRHSWYYNELESQVTQCDGSIFSVRQILHWCAGGVITWSEYGLTFSLETGEMLSLDDFIDMDHDTFHRTTLNFLSEHMLDDWRAESKLDWYERLFHDFSDYTFFYKDGSVYVIFPEECNEPNWIVQWSIQDQAPVECFYGTSRLDEP